MPSQERALVLVVPWSMVAGWDSSSPWLWLELLAVQRVHVQLASMDLPQLVGCDLQVSTTVFSVWEVILVEDQALG